jgi:hypothetical protein
VLARHLGLLQVDAYRCSRAWVDQYAVSQPGTAFVLDRPDEVAWVVLSGKKPGTTVEALYRGWATTADKWQRAEYSWLRTRVDLAYRQVWDAADRPVTRMTEALQCLQLLASMLGLAEHS